MCCAASADSSEFPVSFQLPTHELTRGCLYFGSTLTIFGAKVSAGNCDAASSRRQERRGNGIG
jgi:hypothetical protein